MRTSLFVVFLAGCQTEVYSLTIDNSTDTVVPGGEVDPDVPLDPAMLQDLLGFSVDPQQLADRGVTEQDISNLALVGLTLSAVSPAGADLGFLTHLEVWVTSDNRADAQLFSYDGFAPGQTQFTIPIDQRDLTPWIFDDGFDVVSFVDGGVPTVDTTVRADIKIEIGTTLQGVIDQLN